ncbi:MAG: glycosyltransferase family 2 protein [Chloroflexi bacterium]|nr:glycosyltransferase family 2 protein [Chloroflexota bacterium]
MVSALRSDAAATAVTAISNSEVSIVMPCLNERESIAFCIERAEAALRDLNVSGEIIVADNGSTDGSADIARALGAVVVDQPERGYGNAYLMGFASARGRYIVMADADGTYDFSQLPRFLDLLRGGYDFVTGDRTGGHTGAGAIPPLHRYVGVPLLTGLLNVVSGARVTDAHCGLRAFTREALDAMDLHTGGMEFASEMIIKAVRNGLKVGEVPIDYHPRIGESKLRSFPDGWRHLRFMLLYSPTHLFLIPGMAMLAAGLLILTALVGGPIRIGALFFDFHFMVLGSLLALVGLQVGCLGIYGRSYAMSQGMIRQDRLISRLAPHCTLERGLILGLAVMSAGFAMLLGILITWIGDGFGLRDGILIRPALLGMTLVAAGTQILFSSFFVSLLFIKVAKTPTGRHLRLVESGS